MTTPASILVYGQLDQCRGRIGEVLDLLRELAIPAEISVSHAGAYGHEAAVQKWAASGRVVAPAVYPPDFDATCTDQNWWAYDQATCLRLLRCWQATVQSHYGFTPTAITTYTPGTAFLAACRELGIRTLLGFCGPCVNNDGHWQICHTGAPLAPYVAAEDDFRHPAPADADGVLMVNMETRSPLTCADYWNEGPFDPLNLVMGDRTIEPGDAPVECFAAIEDWIALSNTTGQSQLAIINLQYFTGPRCFDLNRALLRWLRRQADLGRITFTTAEAWRAGLTRHDGVTPQVQWWRGETMGMQCGGQAGDGVPCLLIEDATGQWVFRRGAAGAERHYDYTGAWNGPAFTADGSFPLNRGYAARLTSRVISDDDTSRTLTLTWSDATAGAYLCAWDAADGLASPSTTQAGLRVVPHPGGVGAAVLFAASAPSGSLAVHLTHCGRTTASRSQRWAELVAVETALIDGRAVTRIAPLVPYRLTIPVCNFSTAGAPWEAIDGQHSQRGNLLPGATLLVTLDGTRSSSVVRLWDVEASDLRPDATALAAESARLTAHEQHVIKDLALSQTHPGHVAQLGDEAAIPAWAMAAAQAGATREITAVDAAAPLRGMMVQHAVHAAITLPYGSKTRVRSATFDRWHGTGPAQLFPIYYDYGQAYAPGVAGWNQFWEITLGLRGLDPSQRWRVTLNLYDPESRNGALRIHGQACDDHGADRSGPQYHLCDLSPLAQGLDARHHPAAFFTFDLPPELIQRGACALSLRSHSEARRYCRWAEGFGFVFLAHAWLGTYDPESGA